MNLQTGILILCTLLFMGCSNFSPKEETKKSGMSILKTDSIITYTHTYDSTFHSKYSYQPDSLYEILTHYKTNKSELADFYRLAATSNQGKCFVEKMKHIYAYSKLFKLNLPKGARIIETKKISHKENADRTLILWMIDPYVQIDYEQFYTCPEYTTGKTYFEGKTYISLVATKNNKIINTIRIENDTFTLSDTIGNKITHNVFSGERIPISALKRIRSRGAMSGKYFTINSTDSTDGAVEIFHLEDFNQDGKSFEFAFFENFGCAGTSCTLYGYSHLQDKIIHYPIETTHHADIWNDTLKVSNRDTTYKETTYWVDALFTLNPKPFPIKFAIDYRGRGGEYNYYLFHYDKERELFTETIDSRSKEEDAHIPTSWMPAIH